MPRPVALAIGQDQQNVQDHHAAAENRVAENGLTEIRAAHVRREWTGTDNQASAHSAVPVVNDSSREYPVDR